MTQGIRSTMREFTGTVIETCPWSAFRKPYVQRVLEAQNFEGGELAFAFPQASHKLVEGIGFYRRVDNRVACNLLDIEIANRKRQG